ncbi:PH domain-containing protein [Paenibacillus xylanexedens]|uniref:PH domain-containing protein n=1 Tax=Paenibacillus xylanexedens TaxID=528191 RepID=UPI00119CF5B5|nr:PH domain-containing protein [Paenibacillus xylanexedens]
MTEMKRHHALSLLWSLGNLLKSTFAFILFLFVFRAGSDSTWVFYARIIFYIGISIALISIIWKWFTTRYAADEKAFHIYTGAFSRTRRTIPYTKVQNVSRHTSFLHRLFGVTSIRFETGIKGDDATFLLQVVSVSEAERLEKQVALHLSEVQATVEGIMDDERNVQDEKSLLAERDIETEEQAGSDVSANANDNANGIKGKLEHVVHYRSTRKDVFKASFTSLSFLVLIPILGSLYSTVKDFFPDETVTESLVLSWLESWWVTSLIILLLILISVGLGIVRTFVKYGDFQITSDDKRIYITKGMLEKTSFSIQKDRVQAVKITQSLMKRMLGLAEVELTTAGSLGEASQEINTLYPFLPVREAYRIIEEMLPSYHVTEEMQRLPQKALWLRVLKPNWLWIIVTGVLAYFKPVLFSMEQSWWMISLLLLVCITTCRVVNFYHTRYALNDQFIQFRSGALTSTLFLSKREKVIEIKITRHPLQRKLGLASIHTVNRAKPVMHHHVHDIPGDVANAFQMWYMRRSNEVQIR